MASFLSRAVKTFEWLFAVKINRSLCCPQAPSSKQDTAWSQIKHGIPYIIYLVGVGGVSLALV